MHHGSIFFTHFNFLAEDMNPSTYFSCGMWIWLRTRGNSNNQILARLKREGSLADFERLEKRTAAGKFLFSQG